MIVINQFPFIAEIVLSLVEKAEKISQRTVIRYVGKMKLGGKSEVRR